MSGDCFDTNVLLYLLSEDAQKPIAPRWRAVALAHFQ